MPVSVSLLVSACLLGADCKYSGGNNLAPALRPLLELPGVSIVPVCPECYGGLPTPRPPAERHGDTVIAKTGADVTEAYRRGAETALLFARQLHCSFALLKANSPSCGCGTIYDGSFTGTKIPGNGVTAELLLQNGIPVFTEQNWQELYRLLTE